MLNKLNKIINEYAKDSLKGSELFGSIIKGIEHAKWFDVGGSSYKTSYKYGKGVLNIVLKNAHKTHVTYDGDNLNIETPYGQLDIPKDILELFDGIKNNIIDAITEHVDTSGEKSPILNNPKFKEWFNGSKVTDNEGRPLILYHGSMSDFQEFSREYKSKNETSSLGFWFTNDPSVAGEFAIDLEFFFGQEIKRDVVGGNIKPVFLSIKNPKIYTNEKANEGTKTYRKELIEKIRLAEIEANDFREAEGVYFGSPRYNELKRKLEIITNMKKELDSSKIFAVDRDSFEVLMDDRDEFAYYTGHDEKHAPYKGYWRKRMMALKKDKTNQEFADHLKSQGFDGIIIEGTTYDQVNDEPVNQYVVFESNQIKSIFAKEFNPQSNNIMEGRVLNKLNIIIEKFLEALSVDTYNDSIITNPSFREIVKLSKSLKTGELRFIYDKDNYHVASGEIYLHNQIADFVGMEKFSKGFSYLDSGKLHIFLYAKTYEGETVEGMENFFKSSKMYGVLKPYVKSITVERV